jgi:geranylgeranyl reductase family protein
MYDVIVAGAGPSGALCACQLAQAGLKVALLEKASLPRHKPCGGGLTLKTIKAIPFVIDEVLEFSARGGMVTFAGKPLLKTETATPLAYLVQRMYFDYFLCQKAQSSGAELRTRCAVESVTTRNQHIEVTTSDGELRARYLVGADGVNSSIARSAGLMTDRQTGAALEADLAVPPSALKEQDSFATFDFGALPHGYGWIFPKREHLSVGVFQANPGKTGGLKRILETFIASQKVLREHKVLHWRGHPIPLGGSQHALQKDRILLVGDAANLADPWLGEGLYGAVTSARLAAECISKALQGEINAIEQYTQRINDELVRIYRQARQFAAWVYRFPRLGSELLARSTKMQELVFSAIRGDIDYALLNRNLVSSLPTILAQAVITTRTPPSRSERGKGNHE